MKRNENWRRNELATPSANDSVAAKYQRAIAYEMAAEAIENSVSMAASDESLESETIRRERGGSQPGGGHQSSNQASMTKNSWPSGQTWLIMMGGVAKAAIQLNQAAEVAAWQSQHEGSEINGNGSAGEGDNGGA